MNGFYDYINLLIIPTDYCNLRCEYCFHNAYFVEKNKVIMPIDTIKHIFDIVLPYYNKVNIIWHGGEPLSAGLEFYKEVIKLQKLFQKNDDQVKHAIQTNLTLLDEEMLLFLKENKFTIGTSFDGTMNDFSRHNTSLFLNKLDLLRKHDIKTGVIQVVSGINNRTLIKDYEYFKSLDLSYGMNPYLHANEEDKHLILDDKEYVEKTLELFEYWLQDTQCNIRLKFFEKYIDYIVKKRKTVCTVTSCLGKWICIRPDGKITPCDRYFPDEYSYGNVFEYDNIINCFQSEGFRNILTKSIKRREKCKACDIYDFCNGGCNSVAYVQTGLENNGGAACDTTKRIYHSIKLSLRDIFDKSSKEVERNYNPYIIQIYKDAKNI